MIRKIKVGDTWSGRDREDTAGSLPGGPFNQGDQPGFVGVSGDGSEGSAFGGDGVHLRPPDAAVSPDLNPIEQVFSKLKVHLRRIVARTFTGMFNAIGEICRLHDTTECWSYFKAVGYISS